MKLFVTIYNDATLLEHFLRHYTAAGIGEFFIAAGPEWEGDVRQFTDQYPIVLCTDLPILNSLYGSAPIFDMRLRHQGKNEWVAIVDLDEFVEFPDKIDRLTAEAERDGANVIRGIMHDRFSADGSLATFGQGSNLSAVFPVKSRFIRDVMRGCDHKGVLVKGHLDSPPTAGHHRFNGERVAKQILEISHYKWIPGSVDRVRTAYGVVTELGISWAVEYKRVLDHYDAHGRFAWEEFGGQLADRFRVEPPARCTDCGAPVWDGERDYALQHFGTILCRADQLSRREGGPRNRH
jgi:hypothetical protein